MSAVIFHSAHFLTDLWHLLEVWNFREVQEEFGVTQAERKIGARNWVIPSASVIRSPSQK
jgi:hypothetical protein